MTLPLPLPRLLILPALAALLALAVPAAPASAQAGPACACADGFPLESPDLCYEAPGAAIGDFAYVAPSDFLQVVGFGAGGYCRHNAAFQWTDAAGTLACEEFIGCLCSNPAPGPEVLCNGNDDDCDPATSDEPPSDSCDVPGQMGVCKDGVMGCDAGAEACLQVNFPSTEICDNGVDDNCDGVENEGCEPVCVDGSFFDPPTSCVSDVGQCWSGRLVTVFCDSCAAFACSDGTPCLPDVFGGSGCVFLGGSCPLSEMVCASGRRDVLGQFCSAIPNQQQCPIAFQDSLFFVYDSILYQYGDGQSGTCFAPGALAGGLIDAELGGACQ